MKEIARVSNNYYKTVNKWRAMGCLAILFALFSPFLYWYPLAVSAYFIFMLFLVKHETLIAYNGKFVIEYKAILQRFDESEEFQYSDIAKFDYDKEFLNVKGGHLDLPYEQVRTAKKNTIEIEMKNGLWRVINEVGTKLEFKVFAKIVNNKLFELGVVNKIDDDLSDFEINRKDEIELYSRDFILLYGLTFTLISSSILISMNLKRLNNEKLILPCILISTLYQIAYVVATLLSSIIIPDEYIVIPFIAFLFLGLYLQKVFLLSDKVYDSAYFNYRNIFPPWLIAVSIIFLGGLIITVRPHLF